MERLVNTYVLAIKFKLNLNLILSSCYSAALYVCFLVTHVVFSKKGGDVSCSTQRAVFLIPWATGSQYLLWEMTLV